jgi:hypothetical protein
MRHEAKIHISHERHTSLKQNTEHKAKTNKKGQIAQKEKSVKRG